jgi:hypothetical protein
MKKFLLILTVFVATLTTVSAQEKWKEKDAFHEVMSKTFHPAEEGKLEPIRTRSQEMVDKAIAWQKSDFPDGIDEKGVKKGLKELVKGTKELNELVKQKATDAVLKEKLSSLHDVFHTIVEKCEKEEHH